MSSGDSAPKPTEQEVVAPEPAEQGVELGAVEAVVARWCRPRGRPDEAAEARVPAVGADVRGGPVGRRDAVPAPAPWRSARPRRRRRRRTAPASEVSVASTVGGARPSGPASGAGHRRRRGRAVGSTVEVAVVGPGVGVGVGDVGHGVRGSRRERVAGTDRGDGRGGRRTTPSPCTQLLGMSPTTPFTKTVLAFDRGVVRHGAVRRRGPCRPGRTPGPRTGSRSVEMPFLGRGDLAFVVVGRPTGRTSDWTNGFSPVL